MTTLVCMLLLPRVRNSLGFELCNLKAVAAAATENPVAPERRLRRKIEENSLPIFVSSLSIYDKLMK